MDIKLILAIITITLALVFYTIGVFSERRSGSLKKKHVILFWVGLLFDTTGTTIMSTMSNEGSLLSLHGLTGMMAIVLMLFHAIWATVVHVKNDLEKSKKFHKFSIVVWLVWLVPYILGVYVGMGH